MQSTQIIMMVVLMGGGLAYTLYVTTRARKQMPGAFRMFFERTGYRYADIYQQPLDAHIMHGETLMKNAREGYRVHMVRNFNGLFVHNEQETKVCSDRMEISNSWWADLQQPPRILFQVADRSLTGMGKAVMEAFSNQERVWNPTYPQEVQSGDPDLDRRFIFFAMQPEAVQHVLRCPGMKELLMGCAEVDLVVYPNRVHFADPLQKNMVAGMGGYLGNVASATNMQKRMEMTIPVHDRIANLLMTTARASA